MLVGYLDRIEPASENGRQDLPYDPFSLKTILLFHLFFFTFFLIFMSNVLLEGYELKQFLYIVTEYQISRIKCQFHSW
jgi:hypothetical protein